MKDICRHCHRILDKHEKRDNNRCWFKLTYYEKMPLWIRMLNWVGNSLAFCGALVFLFLFMALISNIFSDLCCCGK